MFPSASTTSCLGFTSFGKSPHGLLVSSSYNSAQNHSRIFFSEGTAFNFNSQLVSMNTVHSSFEPRWSNLPTLTRKIEVNSGDPHTPELVCVLITSKYENFIDNMKVIGKLCDRLQPSNLKDTSIVGLELLMCSKSLINSYQKTSSICLDKIEQEVFVTNFRHKTDLVSRF